MSSSTTSPSPPNNGLVLNNNNNNNTLNKAKNRGGNKPAAGKIKSSPKNSSDSTDGPSGVYANSRFTHAVTSLVGATVSVETVTKDTFEGVLKTFSNNFAIVLEQCHKVDKNNPEDICQETFQGTQVFNLRDIIRVYSLDVDMDYASKKTFQTDTQISGRANGRGPMRKLEEWVPENDEDDGAAELESLDYKGTSSNGWDAREMFAKNEQNYGVKSTYKENMEGYTCPLNQEGKDTMEYKKKEAQAAEIAKQISENTHSTAALELENGDEEDAFSAVRRPVTPHSGGRHYEDKYAARRAALKTTPPRDNNEDYHQHPHHHHGHHGNYSGNSYHKKNRDFHHEEYSKSSYQGRNSNHGNYSNYSPRNSQDNNRRNDYNSAQEGRRYNNPNSGGSSAKKMPQVSAAPKAEKETTTTTTTTKKRGDELKEFGSNFQLSESNNNSSEAPPVSVNQNEEPAKETKKETPPKPAASPSSTVSVAPTAASPAGTDRATSDSPASASKKSTLNPNAKEFVFSSPKTFTRPPIPAATQRPMVSAAPVAGYVAPHFVPGFALQNHVHVPAFANTQQQQQQQQQQQPQQQPRNRGQRDYTRTELTSPLQVAAATGHPLGPIHSQVPYSHQAAQAGLVTSAGHQTGGVVMRMGAPGVQANYPMPAPAGHPMSLEHQTVTPLGIQHQWGHVPPPHHLQPSQQGIPQQPSQGPPPVPLTATPPAQNHASAPSPGPPHVVYPMTVPQVTQGGGNLQYHPSNGQFAATPSPGTHFSPPNLLVLPPTSVGPHALIHQSIMQSQPGQQGIPVSMYSGVPSAAYLAPPNVPGPQNHLLSSHITQ